YSYYAYNFITNTQVGWSYNQATAQVTTNYTATTTTMEGSYVGTLFALYRHQWLDMPASAINTPYTYISPRGTMKVPVGTGFTTTNTSPGGRPELPPHRGNYDWATLDGYVRALSDTAELFPATGNGELDTYWQGKSMNKVQQALRVADQIG